MREHRDAVLFFVVASILCDVLLQKRIDRFFYHRKNKATDAVADQVCHGKCPSNDSGHECVVLKSQQSYDIKILRELYKRGKQKNIYRQGRYTFWNNDPAQAADESRYEHVANVGADKTVMDKQGDVYFCKKENTKNDRVRQPQLFHRVFTAFCQRLVSD